MNPILRVATLVVFAVYGVIALAAPPPLTCPTISLAPTSLPNGDLATAYTSTVTSSGGAAPVVIDITHGVLPTGVNLTDNGNGTATFSGTSTQTGTFEFTITATDTNGCSGGRTYAPTFAAATSTTALALTAGPNPSVFGQSLTFTATVTSGSGTPAGNVTFKDGATTLGTVALDGSGQATFTTSTLSVGTHSPITAVYAGNASFAGSTSNSLSQTVNQATTTTTLVADVNPSVFGQPVTLTATVTANAPGAGTPTGTVTFTDGVTNIGSGALNGSGVATMTTSSLAVGAHQITATYGADTNFAGSTSNILTQTVNQAATATGVASVTNPSVFGQPVTFTAAVTAVAPGAGTPTGTVTFFDGATNIGSGALNGSGVATVTTSTLSVSSHSITATYNADTNFTGSTSSAITQTVNQAATSTALTSSPNPSAANQSVTFTATVTATAPGAGTPTGTVTFFDGATNIGSGALAAGVATFATSTLTVGSHSITATYNGDTNFTTSTSAPLTQTVNLNPSATALTSSVNPTVFGQSTTFTATVTGAGAPTGTVAFMDGATLLGTSPLGGGVATFSTASLAVGTHSITAVYSGDSSFAASTSAPLTQTVNQAATTTTVTSGTNPSVFGQPVTLTATVAAVAPGAGTPTGTVTFKDGVTVLGAPVTLNGSGQATFTSSAFAVGAHQITATYSADTNFLASDNTASPFTQTVNQAATTTTVASGTNPSVFGQSVTFTATVTPVAPGAGTPTGTVTFKDGAVVLSAAVAVNGSGQAVFTTNTLSVSVHSITAVYNADTNFTTSTSSALNQTVNQAATSTAVVSSQNPSVTGQSVTFTATVTPTAPGAGTPTGTVQFKDGGVNMGAPAAMAGGVATFTTTTLGVGAHSITAVYSGDANFTSSTSGTLTQNVNQPPAITSANATTFAPGKVGQTFTVTTTGFPSGASMIISQSGTVPSAVTFTNNNDGTATIAGTPAAGTQGSSPYAWTITANNGVAPPANQPFTFNVVCPAITVSGAIPALTFNTAMATATFTQAGGNGAIAWTATGLPAGVSINNGTGDVTGTPSATGTFNATITATDAGGCIGTKAVSVAVGPNAPAQAYTGVGNTQFFITGVVGPPATPAVSSANTLLTGVTPAGTTVTAASCSVNGALSAVDASGHFIMTPNVSAASVTCTYTTSSDSATTGTPASTTANLTFTLNNKVWYVNHGSAGGDGRSNTPFSDMGGGANNLDCAAGTAAGDFIYIFKGTANTTGACTMKANQTLIGAGATLNVPTASPILTVAGVAGNTPTLTGTLTVANNVTVDGIDMSTAATAALINAAATTGLNLHVRNLATTSGAGISMTTAGNTGSITVDSLNVGAAPNGINLGSLGGTLTVNAATITNTTGAAISLAGVTTANLSGVGATTINTNTAGGTGLVLNATAVNISTGGVSIATSGGASGVSDSGGTVTIAAGANNFSITNTNAGQGLVATAGTLTITGSNNKITTATGTALNVANTTIGAGNLNFRSIAAGTAASGPANGIVLNNTGVSGGLTVTGTGAAGSGGTIQKTTGNAIDMTSTGVTSLSTMIIQNSTHLGINGTTLAGFTLANSSVLNNGTVANADHGIKLLDVSGTATFNSDTVTGNHVTNLFFGGTVNSTTVTNSLTVTNGTYGNSPTNSGIQVGMTHTSTLKTATFTNVTFSGNASSGLQVQSNDNSIVGDGVGVPATGTVTVSGCTFTNNAGNTAIDIDQGGGNGAGQMYARLMNNLTMTGNGGPAINVFTSSSATGGTMKVRIDGNHIGNAGVSGSGTTLGPGIRVFLQGKTVNTVTIVNNVVRQTLGSRGVDVEAIGPVTTGQPLTPSDIVITGNDVDTNDETNPSGSLDAIYVAADNQGSPAQLNAEIHGNRIPASTGATGCFDYPTFDGNAPWLYYRIATAGAVAKLFNFGGHANANTEISTTQTAGLAGADIANFGGVQLTLVPVNSIP
jgi:hypothetical protein